MASVRCLDDALGFTGKFGGSGAADIPSQAIVLRNLIEGMDMVMSHILHFYHLAALDYIDTDVAGSIIANTSPWSPRLSTPDMIAASGTVNTLVGHYVTALNIRRKAHEAAAYMDGKHPCTPALIPGGVTNVVTSNMISAVSGLLGNSNAANSGTSIRSFVHNVYIPDVVTVAQLFSGHLLVATDPSSGVGRGCKKYLAYGTFPLTSGSMFITGGYLDATGATLGTWAASGLNPALITEHVKYSKYDDTYTGLNPANGVTAPLPTKGGVSYSWLKAPRYAGNVCEVGPLARVLVNYARGVEPWVSTVNTVMTGVLGLTTGDIPALRSVLGRHAARAIECMVVADAMTGWLGQLSVTSATGQTYMHRDIPGAPVQGMGLTEAPRGALGHWIRIDGKKVSKYQCVVPTTWNASPRDDSDVPGAMEQALSGMTISGTGDTFGMVKALRIVRSFDPCIACAVHVVSPDKKEVVKFEIPSP